MHEDFDDRPGPADPLAARVAALERANGELVGLNAELAAANAQLVEANAELARSRAELSRSNVALERVATIAVRDLAEPLRSIAAPAAVLARRYRDVLDADGRRLIDLIGDGCARLRARIDETLRRARATRDGPGWVEVDLVRVVGDATAALGPAIRDAGASIHVSDLPPVRGHPTQLQQVFQSLVTNCLKFVDPAVPPIVRIEHERRGTMWWITVADNGIGIDPAQRDRVFEPFRRVHDADRFPGAGLGLALCRRIVEEHGGAIGLADGAGGQGTTVWITLPVLDGPLRSGDGPAPSSG